MVGLATVFGAGGGTSSYQEAEAADVIVMWGSNARNAHPIFFHHVLKAIHRGAKVYVIDPRRTSTAEWANGWLSLEVGTDIALANAVGRCILDEGLEHKDFIARATSGFEDYRALLPLLEPVVLPLGMALYESEPGRSGPYSCRLSRSR